MLFRLLLLLLAGLTVFACPTGYTDGGGGNCQSGKLAATTQFAAYSNCAANNGYMSVIQNGFDNINTNSQSGGSSLWLGLTCTDSVKTSCVWDNGAAVLNTSYTNFAVGHPNPGIGACVYFNPTTNQWYSSPCGGVSYSYICFITPGINVPTCPSAMFFFRGKCYYTISDLHFSNSATRCYGDCGYITSIHNPGENSYVRDVVQQNSAATIYSYIGLTCSTSNCYWSDHTAYNYSTFDHQDANLGSCVFLSTSSRAIVPTGLWVSTDCDENGISVCKRAVNCPAAQTPITCNGTQYFSGTGDIKSPGYPRGAVQNNCQYAITQTSGFGVTLTFTELNLDASSTIKIYNNLLDTIPFATLNSSSTANETTFYSADNAFGIIFSTTGNADFTNIWRAKFDSHKEGDNHCGGIYTYPGTIAGPRVAKSCTYTLKMGGQRTCLRFTSYKVQPRDYISIYDGEISPENNIAYGSLTPYYYVVLCTSNTNYMNLVTIGNSGQSYEMFTISVAGSPDSLQIPYAFGGTLFGEPPLPLTNSSFLAQRYQGTYQRSYASGNIQKRVQVVFSYLKMPDPNNIVILDGGFNSPVALAYGSPTRMTYQSSQQNLTVCTIYNQPSTLSYNIGFSGDFIAV